MATAGKDKARSWLLVTVKNFHNVPLYLARERNSRPRIGQDRKRVFKPQCITVIFVLLILLS